METKNALVIIPKIATREAWLMACIEELQGDFSIHGYTIPEKIRASCSWPSRGALTKNKRIGEAWSCNNSADQHYEIFISPVLQNSGTVCETIVHELIHCVVGTSANHGKPFRQCAEKMGLEGPMTSTWAGSALSQRIIGIIDKLGKYPHAELKSNSIKKTQTTRYIKVTCTQCECVIRMTRKWIEQVGFPTCGCGGSMKQEQGDKNDRNNEN